MIVALSGIGEQGISGDVAVRPCHIGAGPCISHSAGAEDIVESEDWRILVVEESTGETGLPGFCDYYVIGQFRLGIEFFGKDAGTECGGVVVGNRVIDEYRSTLACHVETSAVAKGLIAGDEILDNQGIRIQTTISVDAASLTACLTSHGINPLDAIIFEDLRSAAIQADAAPSLTLITRDHIVEDLYRRTTLDVDSPTTSCSGTNIVGVASDYVPLY